jgi:Arginyl tRNA synthetase N terminal domain
MTGKIDHALGKLEGLIMEASSSQAPAQNHATAAASPPVVRSNGIPAPTGGSSPALWHAVLCQPMLIQRHNSVTLTSGVLNADRVPHLAVELRTLFSAALEQAYPGIGIQPIIAQTGNPKFGDYQCNNAMALFGKLKGQVCAADI